MRPTNRCEFIKHGETEAGTKLGTTLALNLDSADSKAKREASSRSGKGEQAAKGGPKKTTGAKKQGGETRPGAAAAAAAVGVATPPPPPPAPEDQGKETVHATESLASFMSDHGMGSYHSSTVKLLTLLGKVGQAQARAM